MLAVHENPRRVFIHEPRVRFLLISCRGFASFQTPSPRIPKLSSQNFGQASTTMDPEHGRSSLNEKETAEDIQVSRVEATPPYDAERHRLLRRKIDRHLMPICFWVYLINYLDRSNIGNAKILNSETGDSLLQSLNMSPNGYAVTVTLFAIAYSIFDVPANIVLKRFFRPSLWFGSLFFLWGVLTLASGFQKTYPSAVVIRFFIGALEAGFYPGTLR